jgi:nucleotide-binding universal stress UspA family protein
MTLKSILVATDFSEPARAALAHGKALARSHDATLHVLHVVQHIPTYYGSEVGLAVAGIEEQIAASAQRQLDLAVGDDSGVVVRTSTTRASKVAQAITEYAEASDVDLIVVGTHGRGAVSRFLIGSVAERVVRSASRPVLTVHALEGDSRLIDSEVVAHETAEGVPV